MTIVVIGTLRVKVSEQPEAIQGLFADTLYRMRIRPEIRAFTVLLRFAHEALFFLMESSKSSIGRVIFTSITYRQFMWMCI